MNNSLEHRQNASERILVVDDEQALRYIYSRILSKHLPTAKVDTASNGEEAVKMFCDIDYDLIIMDVSMPIKDGHQAFLEIRDICSEKNKEMPSVIFCSGYTFTFNIIELITTDRRHCIIDKPVRKDDLITIVKEKLYAKLP